MLDSEGGKYPSATPRCTCLPPRQHCAGVALGSPPPTPLKSTKAKSRYNEAKLRCTCPLSESTLHLGRWGAPPLLCDFRLVHWRIPWFLLCRKCYNVIIHIQHVTLWRWRLPWRKRTWHHRKSENFQMSTLFVSHEIISQTVHERTIWNSLFAKKDTRKWDRLKSLFFTTTYLSV